MGIFKALVQEKGKNVTKDLFCSIHIHMYMHAVCIEEKYTYIYTHIHISLQILQTR
jgi:hypothetical protein